MEIVHSVVGNAGSVGNVFAVKLPIQFMSEKAAPTSVSDMSSITLRSILGTKFILTAFHTRINRNLPRATCYCYDHPLSGISGIMDRDFRYFISHFLSNQNEYKSLHVQLVKPRDTGEFELRIQRGKRALKNQAKLDGRSMVIIPIP